MPQIKDYSAPASIGINPTDRGTDAAAATARRVGSFFTQVGGATQDLGSKTAQLGNTEAAKFAALGRDASTSIQAGGDAYVQYEDHKQISAGAAKFAEIQAGLTEKWNQFAKNADPNDTTVGAKFNETVLQPTLDEFKESFSTEKSQAWAESHASALQLHMQQKASADMSTMAGIAVRTNAERMVNSLSSAVASDPSSLDFSLKTVESSIGAIVSSSPTLDATTAASVHSEVTLKAKEAIVKSAVSGMITKNPNVDLDAIQKKYGEYINGAEMKMFQKAAQVQAKVDRLQDRQAETYARQKEEHAANDEMTKVITNNVTIDQQSGRPVINPRALPDALEIAKKYPQAGSGLVRTTIDWIESQQNKERKVVDDPALVTSLTNRLFDPTSPTTRQDLMKAQIAGKMSDHTFQSMDRLVRDMDESPLKGPVYQDTMKAVHDQLVVNVPGIPGKDTVGTTNYAKFVQSFVPQYIAKSRAGTVEPNALDVNDPNSMISKAAAPFKRTQAQRMSDYVSGAGGLSPAVPAATNRKVGDVPVPASLGGIAALQFNPTTKQWRDQTSGKIYDSAGHEVN